MCILYMFGCNFLIICRVYSVWFNCKVYKNIICFLSDMIVCGVQMFNMQSVKFFESFIKESIDDWEDKFYRVR